MNSKHWPGRNTLANPPIQMERFESMWEEEEWRTEKSNKWDVPTWVTSISSVRECFSFVPQSSSSWICACRPRSWMWWGDKFSIRIRYENRWISWIALVWTLRTLVCPTWLSDQNERWSKSNIEGSLWEHAWNQTKKKLWLPMNTYRLVAMTRTPSVVATVDFSHIDCCSRNILVARMANCSKV